jgi:hypothetical protein
LEFFETSGRNLLAALTPGANPRIGATFFEDWLQHAARSASDLSSFGLLGPDDREIDLGLHGRPRPGANGV